MHVTEAPPNLLNKQESVPYKSAPNYMVPTVKSNESVFKLCTLMRKYSVQKMDAVNQRIAHGK